MFLTCKHGMLLGWDAIIKATYDTIYILPCKHGMLVHMETHPHTDVFDVPFPLVGQKNHVEGPPR